MFWPDLSRHGLALWPSYNEAGQSEFLVVPLIDFGQSEWLWGQSDQVHLSQNEDGPGWRISGRPGEVQSAILTELFPASRLLWTDQSYEDLLARAETQRQLDQPLWWYVVEEPHPEIVAQMPDDSRDVSVMLGAPTEAISEAWGVVRVAHASGVEPLLPDADSVDPDFPLGVWLMDRRHLYDDHVDTARQAVLTKIERRLSGQESAEEADDTEDASEEEASADLASSSDQGDDEPAGAGADGRREDAGEVLPFARKHLTGAGYRWLTRHEDVMRKGLLPVYGVSFSPGELETRIKEARKAAKGLKRDAFWPEKPGEALAGFADLKKLTEAKANGEAGFEGLSLGGFLYQRAMRNLAPANPGHVWAPRRDGRRGWPSDIEEGQHWFYRAAAYTGAIVTAKAKADAVHTTQEAGNVLGEMLACRPMTQSWVEMTKAADNPFLSVGLASFGMNGRYLLDRSGLSEEDLRAMEDSPAERMIEEASKIVMPLTAPQLNWTLIDADRVNPRRPSSRRVTSSMEVHVFNALLSVQDQLIEKVLDDPVLNDWPKIPSEYPPESIFFRVKDADWEWLKDRNEAVFDALQTLEEREGVDAVFERYLNEMASGFAAEGDQGEARQEKAPSSQGAEDEPEMPALPVFKKPRPDLEESHRTGGEEAVADATEDELIERFGLRGIQYGNWVTQAERQDFLNQSRDAFADLAKAMGVPEAFVGFYGQLGLAFGARGRGGKVAAHYEPDLVVINLTRFMGAGALGHEWGHALDHFLSRQVGQPGIAYLSERHVSSVMRKRRKIDFVIKQPPPGEALDQAMTGFMSTVIKYETREEQMKVVEQVKEAQARLNRSQLEKAVLSPKFLDIVCSNMQYRHFEDVGHFLKDHPEQRAEVKRIAAGWMDRVKPVFDGWVNNPASLFSYIKGTLTFVREDLVEKVLKRLEEVEGRQASQTERCFVDQWVREFPFSKASAFYRAQSSAARQVSGFGTLFWESAATLDQGRSGDPYWTKPRELFARAFQSVIHHRLDAKGINNPMLTDYAKPSKFTGAEYLTSPNLEGDEVARASTAMEPLLEEVATLASSLRESEVAISEVAPERHDQELSGLSPE